MGKNFEKGISLKSSPENYTQYFYIVTSLLDPHKNVPWCGIYDNVEQAFELRDEMRSWYPEYCHKYIQVETIYRNQPHRNVAAQIKTNGG